MSQATVGSLLSSGRRQLRHIHGAVKFAVAAVFCLGATVALPDSDGAAGADSASAEDIGA